PNYNPQYNPNVNPQPNYIPNYIPNQNFSPTPNDEHNPGNNVHFSKKPPNSYNQGNWSRGQAAVIQVTQEISTSTDDLNIPVKRELIDIKTNYVGAAYELESPNDTEIISTPQFLKLLGKDYGDNRKFTSVMLGNEKFRALIDTGATRTFVGPLIGGLVKNHIINAGGKMKVADGSEVELLGCVVLKLEAHMENCTLPVRVCSALSYDVVLGMDFIAAMGVEFKGNSCTWKGGRVKIEPQSNIVYARPLRIEEDLMLAENSPDTISQEIESPRIVHIAPEVAD
ncbi:hypothetical protein PV325_000376, partial [Microctonus aethiopoides]